MPLINDEDPPSTKYELPERVCQALAVDKPIELLCVDGVRVQRGYQSEDDDAFLYLILYSAANIFLIKAVEPSGSSGRIVQKLSPDSVSEPLEPYLDRNYNAAIVRVRQAPQALNIGNPAVDYIPRGSFAVLLEDVENQKYNLVLYHQTKTGGRPTVPLKFAVERLGAGKRVVDFCFAESDGLSLVSTCSVLLLEGSGDILSAGAIVFDGMKVKNRYLDEVLEFLDGKIKSLSPGSCMWKRCKVAKHYFSEVFVKSGTTAKARIIDGPHPASWPAKIQDAVYLHTSGVGDTTASSIESFDGTEFLAGLVTATNQGKLNFVGISPTSLLPRFQFESDVDGLELDDMSFKNSASVERVELGVESTAIALLKDPFESSMIHLATSTSVCTIQTNTMTFTSKAMFGPVNDHLSTTAWTSYRSDHSLPIAGAAIVSDPVEGHRAVVQLASGVVASSDITRSKYAEELNSVMKDVMSTDPKQMKSTSEIPSLQKDLVPLFEQINCGLAGMERLVGSSTNYEDVTAESLAWIADRMDRCDKEITIPLQEMKSIVDAARPKLEERLQKQRTEIKKLLREVNNCIARFDEMSEKLQAASENDKGLSDRSIRLFRMCEQLRPELTKQERDYFHCVDRLAIKTSKVEDAAEETKLAIGRSCETLENGFTVELSPDHIEQLNQTLRGCGGFQAQAQSCLETSSKTISGRNDD